MNLLVSAFACRPGYGSEPGVGWGLTKFLSQRHKITLLTDITNLSAIRNTLTDEHQIKIMGFAPPTFFNRYSLFGAIIYYSLWLLKAYQIANFINGNRSFDAVVHLTYVNSWIPPLFGFLDIPFLWCAGTRQTTPYNFLTSMSASQRINEILRNVALKTFGGFSNQMASRSNVWIVSNSPIQHWGNKALHLIPGAIGGLPIEELKTLASLNIVKQRNQMFRILSVGRLLGLKGFSLGIRAFALFHQKCPNSEYWIIGKGPEKDFLRRLAYSLGLEGSVRFIDWMPREELFRLYKESDVLLHPSLHEQFGYVVLESMAAGRPVICLDVGGPSFLVDENTGIKIPPYNPKQTVTDIAEALYRLAHDYNLRTKMGDLARVNAWKWSWELFGAKFEKWLEDIIGA